MTEDGPLPIPFEALQAIGAKSPWHVNNVTIDDSKGEFSWPVNSINYLLLCYLVAKEQRSTN